MDNARNTSQSLVFIWNETFFPRLAVASIWESVHKASWYQAEVNHADGTCKNGNSWWNPRQMPCKWYRRMSRRAAAAAGILV